MAKSTAQTKSPVREKVDKIDISAPGNGNEKASATMDGKELHVEEVTPLRPAALPAVLTVEQRAKNEVARFDVAREAIASKMTEFKDLTIAGVDDKEGEKKVTEAWRWFKDKRIAVGKKKDEIKQDYLIITRAVDKENNELTELLKEGEKKFGDELDRIEAMRTAEKEKVEREAQQKLQSRVAELLGNGMAFSGAYYTIGETISMDVVTLKGMADDKYAELLQRVRTENQKIIDAQAEADRLKKESEDKIEAQRLQNEKDAEKLKQDQQKLNEQLAKLKEGRTKARGRELEALGMVYGAGTFLFKFATKDHGDSLVNGSDVDEMEDDDFEALLSDRKKEIAKMKERQAITDENTRIEAENKAADELKKKKEKEALDQRTALRQIKAQQIGLSETIGGEYGRRSKYPMIRVGVAISHNDIIKLDATEWDLLIDQTILDIASLAAAEANEDKRIADENEKERLAGLTDVDALKEFNTKLLALIGTMPMGKSKKMATAVSGARNGLMAVFSVLQGLTETLVKKK